MKASVRTTLLASIVGTVVGVGGWLLGAGKAMWPAHPWWALFFMSLAATILAEILDRKDAGKN